ncbi:MAG: ferritin-like domain-containing protein, partial [Actinomycetota bacterium]
LHLDETRGQVNRLGQVFEQLDLSARGKRCEAMDGLIEEARSLLEEDAEPEVLDAGIIACAQKVEHYEIASYGCCATWARQLGLRSVARLLDQSLEEEKQADVKLTSIAEQNINRQAETAGARRCRADRFDGPTTGRVWRRPPRESNRSRHRRWRDLSRFAVTRAAVRRWTDAGWPARGWRIMQVAKNGRIRTYRLDERTSWQLDNLLERIDEMDTRPRTGCSGRSSWSPATA